MKKVHNTLTISHLQASIEGKEILRDISFTVNSGEVHVIMGPNGSGKSTLAYAMMGHPAYRVKETSSKVTINGKNILTIPTEERAKEGLFLAFQSPTAVPGVSVVNLLRTAYQELHGVDKAKNDNKVQNPLLARRWKAEGMSLMEFMDVLKINAKALRIDDTFLSRGIHDGFSGGEKKKIEMLQALTLSPKFTIFDEIDTGLDVDALKVVAKGIELLSERGTGVIIITHYQRILKYLKPDVVHILIHGKIVKTGIASLAKEVEDEGYENYSNTR
jgi:Fe-S cluster assembly ATP-binding protein